jgi:hypothetical protein
MKTQSWKRHRRVKKTSNWKSGLLKPQPKRSKREQKAKNEILQATQTQAPKKKKKTTTTNKQNQTTSTPAAEAQGSNNYGLLTTLQKTHQNCKK